MLLDTASEGFYTRIPASGKEPQVEAVVDVLGRTAGRPYRM